MTDTWNAALALQAVHDGEVRNTEDDWLFKNRERGWQKANKRLSIVLDRLSRLKWIEAGEVDVTLTPLGRKEFEREQPEPHGRVAADRRTASGYRRLG